MIGRAYVDEVVGDVAAAAEAARSALRRWDVDGEPALVKVGMNALFGVPGRAVVIRVGRATGGAAVAHELARALAAAGIATTTPVDGWVADIDGFAVTGWERVRETRQAVSWEAVGETLRWVHDLPRETVPSSYPVADPVRLPWWDFPTMLADVGGDIDAPALAAIEATVARHDGWQSAISAGAVVCHGDVHPGNVLTAASGPLLLDWDLLAWAHPSWDHAALAMWAERWGGDPGMYPRVAEGYGRSYADDPLTVALGELRNVAATLMRVRAARLDPAAADEAERRLRYWRGDPDAPVWRAW